MESAVGGRRAWAGTLAGDRRELSRPRLDARDFVLQSLGARVIRMGKTFLGGRSFVAPAQIHDRHAVGKMPGRARQVAEAPAGQVRSAPQVHTQAGDRRRPAIGAGRANPDADRRDGPARGPARAIIYHSAPDLPQRNISLG
ncbi:MAG TPA: hypothetical protein VND19_10570 [Acetobacteraceae bacterium]|nr:hypothetical protein [Acetobacteraceae bacterium]